MEAAGRTSGFKALLDAFKKAHGDLHPAFRKAVDSLIGLAPSWQRLTPRL